MIDWDSYHEKYQKDPNTVTIRDTAPAYKVALDHLNIDRPGTVLLGGFAAPFSLRDFEVFCKENLPQAKTLAAMDLNRTPLIAAKRQSLETPIFQGDLTKLPLGKGSVDLMVLDFTLNCMPRENLPNFFNSASEVLTPQGTILASVIDISNARWYSRLWLRSISRGNAPYDHPPIPQIIKSAENFNTACRVNMDHPMFIGPPLSILAFTKK